MEIATKSTNSIFVNEDFFVKLIALEQEERTRNCIPMMQELLEKLSDITEKEFVTIKNKPVLYNKTYNFLIADTRRWFCSDTEFNYELFRKENKPIGRPMLEAEAYDLFFIKRNNPLVFYNSSSNPDFNSSYSNNWYWIKNKNIDTNSYTYYHSVACRYQNHTSENGGFVMCHDGTSGNSPFSDSTTLNIPVCDCQENISAAEVLISEGLIPKGLTEKEEKILEEMIVFYKNKLIKLDEYGFLDTSVLLESVKKDKIKTFQSIPLNREEVGEYLKSNTIQLTSETKKLFVNQFLECDYLRADIDPYDEKIVEDPNRGHWDLWTEEPKSNSIKITVNSPFVGRNPISDIKEDGIIGIDFGTKSTVVVYQDGDDNILPMRVGRGKYRKEIKKSDYENPTVMEFVDIQNFMKRYNAREGRPETLWSDLTVSHRASEQLKDGKDSNKYYTFFSDLKQWSGDKHRKIRIKDDSGYETVLPAFIDIEDGEFNPIELYAYYLGIFINNMYKGIYLNYLLSFPVTYEKSIREKIIHSFERGIKKSLPDEVLKDKEIMSKFRITQGASEPAAYAICALESYAFEPEEGEKIPYAIFDFGGGTTDFDFGIWRYAEGKEARRYDYVIEHFGAGGDQYLGSENLLELLAFHVFKKNRNKLLEEDISFYKPAECKDFAGSEALLSNSQEAKLNTKQLMEKLRDLWENNLEEGNSIEEGLIELMLFTNSGEEKPNSPLEVDKEELLKIVRDRIEVGVKNFFDALTSSFLNKEEISCINIFLAGNSSKSPIVRELFEEYIAEKTSEMKQTFHCKQDNDFFMIYPPLGTEEAERIQAERGIIINRDAVTEPTGKTGVAFGLIEGRPSSKIKVVSEIKSDDEVKFKYYLGVRNRKKFFECIIDRNTAYNEWNAFIDACVADFEIYYTSLPEATTKNSLAIEEAKKKICRIDATSEEAEIYIRFVNPTMIEYVVATEEGIAQGKYLGEITKLEF